MPDVRSLRLRVMPRDPTRNSVDVLPIPLKRSRLMSPCLSAAPLATSSSSASSACTRGAFSTASSLSSSFRCACAARERPALRCTSRCVNRT